ncbi:MAG: Gfo/Idh/MocA family protein [Candidatus Helarchaeota archaeon]
MKEIKIGFIGCGLIAKAHAFGLTMIKEEEISNIEIYGASDIDQGRMNKFGINYGIKNLYENPDDLITNEEIDTIYVCTPTNSHKKYVLKALNEGKNVFCEKPLATNLNDVIEMCEAVKKSKGISQVGFVIRFSPIFEYLKNKLLNDNRLGRMMTIIFRNDQAFPIGGKYKSYWRSNIDMTGGGTLIEHSIHDIDIIMVLGGKFRKLYCNTSYFSDHNVEDLAVLNFELDNGALGTLTSCWHNINRDERLIEIFFENGWLKIEITPLINLEFMIKKKHKKLSQEEIQKQICEDKGIDAKYLIFPYYYEDLEFIRSINNGTKPKATFEDALNAHKIIDAAYKSAKLNKVIEIS